MIFLRNSRPKKKDRETGLKGRGMGGGDSRPAPLRIKVIAKAGPSPMTVSY